MTTPGFDATTPPDTTPTRVEIPDKHGESGDPRYPSPRQLREVFAFVFDWLFHIVVGLVAMTVFLDIPAVADWAALALFIGWIAASLLQRVVAQRIVHTTLGKALFGLCVIRPSDGQWPTLGYLLKWWLLGALDFVATISSSPWTSDYDDAPTVVRRRDVVARDAATRDAEWPNVTSVQLY
ncbi:RDD family protein [Prescottella defluvii]|nr:RDD family protein [Prescottella defluvii]